MPESRGHIFLGGVNGVYIDAREVLKMVVPVLDPSMAWFRRTPHPAIVTTRNSKDCIGVLFYSYYTTVSGWGVPHQAWFFLCTALREGQHFWTSLSPAPTHEMSDRYVSPGPLYVTLKIPIVVYYDTLVGFCFSIPTETPTKTGLPVLACFRCLRQSL